MKILLVLFLTFLSFTTVSQTATVGEKLNVLFIGNSLTYYNGMPKMLQQMLIEGKDMVHVEFSTFPGMQLSGHLEQIVVSRTEHGMNTRIKKPEEMTETEKKLKQKKWDMVVLQEGTLSFLIPEQIDFKLNPAIEKIKLLINNPDCKVVLFHTWPLMTEYPKQFCNPSITIDPSIGKELCCSPEVLDMVHEMKLINEGYESVASFHKITVTDNGKKFYQVIRKYPEINLYEDEVHPSASGAYLNACVFYQYLTGRKASSIKYNGEISKATTEKLKKIAEQDI